MKYDLNQNVKPSLVFLLSLVPGAGHMYMGLMKRGLQLLAGFVLCWAIMEFTYYVTFLVGPAMAVLYIFNLFDAYNCRRRIQQGADIEDELIVEVGGIYVGIGLIVLGGLGLIFTLDNLSNMATIFYDIMGNVIRLLPSIMLLMIGLLLIARARKNAHKGKKKPGQDQAA